MKADSLPVEPIRRSRRSRALRLLSDIATGVVLVAGGLSIGGFFAGAAWPFELMCHFRMQYFATLLGCALLLALCRSRRRLGIALALTALNGWTLWPYVPAGSRPDQGAPDLRVLSTNVYSGNRTPGPILDHIAATQPDIIAVLEVTPAWERHFAAIEVDYPYRLVQTQPENFNFGIALYSRVPLVSARFAPLSDNNSAIVAHVEVNRTAVTIIAAHPYPPGGSLHTRLRNLQLGELARLAAAVDGPVILAGDLNVTPFSPAFQQLLRDGTLSDPRIRRGIKPTWPAGRTILRIPIDHILARQAQIELSVGPDIGSDHFPLSADVWLDTP